MTALSHGMVLAAGLGLRMRPLTGSTAKPLLPLHGRSLLDHALDRLEAAGVREAVVNAHWHADKVAAAVAARAARRASTSSARTRCWTPAAASPAPCPASAPAPSPWSTATACGWTGRPPRWHRLAAAFDPATMDGLLLLVRSAQVEGEVGSGDFLLDPLGRLRRPKEREVAPYLFAGVQVLSPRALRGRAGGPGGAFSLNRLYDRAIAAGRLLRAGA